MVDRDLLLRKLADLDQYLDQASEYRDITIDKNLLPENIEWNL